MIKLTLTLTAREGAKGEERRAWFPGIFGGVERLRRTFVRFFCVSSSPLSTAVYASGVEALEVH